MFLPGAEGMMEWLPKPIAIPEQARADSGFIRIDNARLHYWDTGGSGATVILLHPATGSDRIWVYQQPVFAKAGYRVIAWSRRGHAGSDPVRGGEPGTAVGDLNALLHHLGLERIHLVGCAAGGGIALDYALSHPGRMLSLAVVGAVGGIVEPEYAERARRLRPEDFDSWPASFRELSPSYRAANPAGVREWERLEAEAVIGNRLGQKPEHLIDWTTLARIRTPCLIMGGDADLYSPPALLRVYAAHIPGAELVIVPEGGHSLYWEMPDVFNATLLEFWERRKAMSGPNPAGTP
jgi:pimeloyl-ACP methyl ester carboxylesterase